MTKALSEEAQGRGGKTAIGRWLTARGAQLVELLMPPVCLGCHQPLAARDALCPDCWRSIDFIRPPLCDRLGMPLPYDAGGVMISAAAAADPPDYDRARAVARYDGVMRRLIHGLKYNDHHDVRRLFGRWLAEAGADLLAEADVIVPVPLSRVRLFLRRFNQAALLAAEVARRTGVEYAPLALVRTRPTPSQVGLTREQRRENMRGAFAVPEAQQGRIDGRKVVLVDDVITTGATAGACARSLRGAGAARVDVLALGLVTDTSLHAT